MRSDDEWEADEDDSPLGGDFSQELACFPVSVEWEDNRRPRELDVARSTRAQAPTPSTRESVTSLRFAHIGNGCDDRPHVECPDPKRSSRLLPSLRELAEAYINKD